MNSTNISFLVCEGKESSVHKRTLLLTVCRRAGSIQFTRNLQQCFTDKRDRFDIKYSFLVFFWRVRSNILIGLASRRSTANKLLLRVLSALATRYTQKAATRVIALKLNIISGFVSIVFILSAVNESVSINELPRKKHRGIRPSLMIPG